VTVTVTPKKGNEKKAEKEFDTTMDMQDIGDITGHFHVLPIHAFKSAVHAILKNKKLNYELSRSTNSTSDFTSTKIKCP
jgi:hypothetical protein